MKVRHIVVHPAPPAGGELHAAVARRLVGQTAALEAIIPYVQMYQAGLSPEGRPAGVFLMLGPTGTGKTRTVEVLAEVLHGSAKKLLRVDCGEFQMEHEVAKLIGAPPGYLGHRETQPMFTQQKLNAAASEGNDLTLVLLDEIEKAAPSMTRLLLGILDKAVLRLGDNTTVNFEKALIFMTSNLGARNIRREMHPDFGFEALVPREAANRKQKLENVGLSAVRKKFTPEFVNRIDSVITYQPLEPAALAAILDQNLLDLQAHLDRRLGPRSFRLEISLATRRLLLRLGTSDEYGARELKRTLHRQIIQPLASMLAAGEIPPGLCVRAEVNALRTRVVMRVEARDGVSPLPEWQP
ncbi:MAG: AAA family ATPase [Acidobacteriota bacterium]|nr:AAA family ATPase [Acidobacteriota bacterium]